MSKLYNTEEYFVNNFKDYFYKLDCHLSSPKIKNISHSVPAIVKAENITTLDISKVFHNNSNLLNIESIKKKLWRFLNNPTFKGIDLFTFSPPNINYSIVISFLILTSTPSYYEMI